MTHYITILVPSENGAWRALVPDVPDCEGTGNDPDTAKLAAHYELTRRLRANGTTLPTPRDLSEIAIDKAWMSRHDVDFAKAVVTVIPLEG